jgi:hypothetical protein
MYNTARAAEGEHERLGLREEGGAGGDGRQPPPCLRSPEIKEREGWDGEESEVGGIAKLCRFFTSLKYFVDFNPFSTYT